MLCVTERCRRSHHSSGSEGADFDRLLTTLRVVPLLNYLLVTHIPFRRSAEGAAIVDTLWAEDLRGLAAAVGRVTVAAPELHRSSEGWGTGETALAEAEGIRFAGLPSFSSTAAAFLGSAKLRGALAREVRAADLVHTSNFFPPYVGLAYAHRLATRLGRKTLFVVAEDFVDFVTWNLTQSGAKGLRRWRAERLIAGQDKLARECLRSAMVSFLHTPAAVARYRLDAPRAMAIRQPVHEVEDVILEAKLTQRLAWSGPLRLVAACRLEPLKGLDFLVRAVALLHALGEEIALDIYGKGSERGRLMELVARLGLESAVALHEPLPPGPALRQMLEAHDAAVMPHLTNDFGRAFWDAMAAGLPVVAFRSVAAEDTVRHREDGLLAPMADVSGLADALRMLTRDPQLLAAASRAARTRAVANTKTIWNRIRLNRILEEFPS